MKAEAAGPQARLFIAGSRGRTYIGLSMNRLLSFLVVALALLLSPMAMANGAMAATAQTATHGLMASSHCAGDELPASHDKKSDQFSCAAGCAAIPAVTTCSTRLTMFGEPRVQARDEALIGFVPEGETPPPRT